MVSSGAHRFKQTDLFLSASDFYIDRHFRSIFAIFPESMIESTILSNHFGKFIQEYLNNGASG